MMRTAPAPTEAANRALERAAELFGVLATPVRLRIIGELCASEKNVSHLLGSIDVSQPNMSRHLSVLYQAGIVTRRRSGANVIYALADESVASLCKVVCGQMVSDVAISH